MAPLSQFLDSYYSDITETKFQPIFRQPATEPNGLVCIFHGLGSDPRQYNHLVDFLTSKDYAACSFGLPGHRSSNSDEFSLTNDTIHSFVRSLTTILSNIHHEDIKLFFIGVSFGASFARHFADHFNRPLINAAPFIEPYQWSGYLALKILSTLDWIPLLNLGSRLSQSLPKIAIVSTKRIPSNGSFGLSKLPANSILNAYLWAQRCHFAPKRMTKTLLLFSLYDQTVSNEHAKYTYPHAQIKEYKSPHNILSQIDNPATNISKINEDILEFLTNDKKINHLRHLPNPLTYFKNIYKVLMNIMKNILSDSKIKIKY